MYRETLDQDDTRFNAAQLKAATVKMLDFLRQYDFTHYTAEDFSGKLKEINEYKEIYIHSTYHAAEGPGGSFEWGFTSGSSAYTSYDKRRQTSHLKAEDLPQGKFIMSVLEDFAAHQNVASHIDLYKEKRAAIRTDNLATFRDFEKFLADVKVSEETFEQYEPRTLADIIASKTSSFLKTPATAERAAILSFAAGLKGFEAIRDYLPAVEKQLQMNFKSAVKEMLTKAKPEKSHPDIVGDYVKHGLLKAETGEKIQETFQTASTEINRYRAGLGN